MSRNLQSFSLGLLLAFNSISASAQQLPRQVSLGNIDEKADKVSMNAQMRGISVYIQSGKVLIRGGSQRSYVTSTHPELWIFRDGAAIASAYEFDELHGLRVRITSPMLPPRFECIVQIFDNGKYWTLPYASFVVLLKSIDFEKSAEIRGGELWFDGRKIGDLSKDYVVGEWHSCPDLEIFLSEDFKSAISLQLLNSATVDFNNWSGKELRVNASNFSHCAIGHLSVNRCFLNTTESASINVGSVISSFLEANAQQHSAITINGGRIADARIFEDRREGNIFISAQAGKSELSRAGKVYKSNAVNIDDD